MRLARNGITQSNRGGPSIEVEPIRKQMRSYFGTLPKDMVQKRYLRVDEERAALEQVQDLGTVGKAIFQMWKEVEEGSTEAGIIAKDAEILEMVFTARELVVRGNTDAQSWIDGSRTRMRTASGKELLELINDSDPSEWWRRICK